MLATLVAVFKTADAAHRATEALLSAGWEKDDISLVTPGPAPTGKHGPTLVVRDAEKGALVGGLAGLMLGLTELSLPGVGPILAGGWLVTTLLGAAAGAASGSVAGALIERGLSSDVAHSMAAALDEGKAVVTVTNTYDRITLAADLINQFDPDQLYVHRMAKERELQAQG